MKYRETRGYKYLLVADERLRVDIHRRISHKHIRLNFDGDLTIKQGYAWDGSTIPFKKWFKWLWDADKYCKIASLVHDALCQLMREGLLSKTYKPYIDKLYRNTCIRDGMGKRQANLRYRALRLAGNWGITKRKNPRGQVKDA